MAVQKSSRDDFQDPHRPGAPERQIEQALGRQVREFRRQQNMTLAELAKATGLSSGMLSKIENGATSPSLATLQGLSSALQVPVTALFRRFEERREATHVKAGQGLRIDRRGTRAGHQYELLGHIAGRDVSSEPYLITLTEESDVFPVFQHEGLEFIYVIDGSVRYRHADKTYLLEPGDSLFFDADAPHGPEELIARPIRMVCVISYSQHENK